MSGKVEISKRLILINSASSIGTRIINISILVWLHQHLLRRISPEEYSLYPVLMAVMVFAPLLTTILTSGIGRYVVEAYAKGDERRVTQIVSTMFPLLLGAGIMLMVFGWALAWNVGSILTIAPDRLWDAKIMMALLMFSAAIRLPLAPFGVGLYVQQRFVLLNCIRLGTELVRIVLLFTLLLGISTRVLWVVVASVSASICDLLVQVFISHWLIPALKFHPSEIRWTLAKQVMSFGSWNFVGQVANTIRMASDVIILNKLATPLDVTCFHLGSLPHKQLEQGSGVLFAPLQPPLIGMHAAGSNARLRNAYLRGGRYALWVTCFFAIPAIVYSRELIRLYVGTDYLAAATVMALLLAAFPIAHGNLLMYAVGHAKAQIGQIVRRVAVLQLANLCLTLYLVGFLKMGAVGSALSSFLVGLVGSPLLIYPVGWKLAGVKCKTWVQETLWPGLLPGLAAGMLWIGFRMLSPANSWSILGVYTGIGWLCYLFALFVFCMLPDDRDDLSRLLRKIRSGFSLLRLSPGKEPETN